MRILGLVLLASLFNGRKAPSNPWGAVTLEWQCTSPPPFYNFARPPLVGDPYDFHGLSCDESTQNYVIEQPERVIAPEKAPKYVPTHAGGQE